jgi:hypothetical protein
MQTDMHYFGTYAIARAAGFRKDIAQTIATSAEYVDDSDRLDVTCKDGFKIRAEPTAHHPTNLSANTDPNDQIRTWVPFHFIPGLQGTTDEDRLVCTTDSLIARSVVDHTLNNLDSDFGVPLLGILAHSYADTFSHYGFSGISSHVNLVDAPSINFDCSEAQTATFKERLRLFLSRYAIGPFANHLVQLGHGSVGTFPDQPFLSWDFKYSKPERPSGLRENAKTFLAACERLHDVFCRARAKFNGEHDDLGAYREFSDIQAVVVEILGVEGDAARRAEAWKQASSSGRLCQYAEAIPDYDSRMFTKDLEQLAGYDRDFAVSTLVYDFLQAADFHRNFILNDLLPKNGVHIESAPIEWHS